MTGQRKIRPTRIAAIPTAILALLMVTPSFAQNGPTTGPINIEGKSCTAVGCHDTLTKPKYLHGPIVVDECQHCHQETDRKNHKYQMTADTPGLCYTCHEESQAALRFNPLYLSRHKPVDEGSCLDCHDAHASGHPMMIKQNSVVEMCMSCHDDKISLAGSVHKPIDETGCLDCHRAHHSYHEKLLTAAPEDHCLQCHADTYRQAVALPSVHQPLREKDCSSCHASHASPEQWLLSKPYVTDPYVPFDPESYELCFACHKKELATAPEINTDTKFRNGTLNLHHLNVTKERKGRSCGICHLAHASDLPRLIRPDVAVDQWKAKMSFVPTKTGGYCGVSCHSAKCYDRLVPVDFEKEPMEPVISEKRP